MDYELIPAAQLPPLHEHPLYTTGMTQLNAGQWQQAFQSFQMLQGIYPDDVEVKELLERAQMRATLARVQPRPSSRATKRLNPRRLLIGVVAVTILTIAGYAAYEIWIYPVFSRELLLRQIASLRTAADEAITAGDYAQARQSLEKLQAIFPEDAQTLESLRWVEQVEKSSSLYGEAKALMEAGSWGQAIQVLTELQSLDAEYRDLPDLLQVARESQAMERQFQAAEEAFARGDWTTAIDRYQALQRASLTFRFEEVQTRLFESHLRYAGALLEEAGTDPDQVSQAISQLSAALKLRPMDDEALNQRRLAESYLAALNTQNQDEMINLLQAIYNERPDYAGKQAAQILYSILLERAADRLEAGDEGGATADYQAAARLPVEDPSEAQQKLGELTSRTSP